jgi:hypothetical protein
MASLIGFPNPVNEKAARTVAAGVLTLSLLALVLSLTVSTAWLLITPVLALGFLARVLTGPKLSVLGQLATRVVAPRLGQPRLVPGPPKRFAQGIGLFVTTAGTLALALGVPGLTQVLLGLMVVAAGLEAILGFCLGCAIFAQLMRVGLIPEETCEACNNLALRAEWAEQVTVSA